MSFAGRDSLIVVGTRATSVHGQLALELAYGAKVESIFKLILLLEAES